MNTDSHTGHMRQAKMSSLEVLSEWLLSEDVVLYTSQSSLGWCMGMNLGYCSALKSSNTSQ